MNSQITNFNEKEALRMESLFSIRHVFFSLRFGSTKTYRKNLISHDLNNTGCVVEFLRMAKHEEYIEGLKNIDSEIYAKNKSNHIIPWSSLNTNVIDNSH